MISEFLCLILFWDMMKQRCDHVCTGFDDNNDEPSSTTVIRNEFASLFWIHLDPAHPDVVICAALLIPCHAVHSATGFDGGGSS